MQIETKFFGQVDVREEDVIRLPDGLVGFADVKRYVFLDNPPPATDGQREARALDPGVWRDPANGEAASGPFRWMQAVDRPNLAFVVCDPLLFKPDYKISVRKEDLASIRVEAVDDGVVVVILVVPRDPKAITANLQGPIVVNVTERLAKQLVLSGPEYTTKYRIFGEPGPEEAGS